MCVITSTIATAAIAIATAAAAATSTAVTLSQVSAQKKSAAYQLEQNKKEAKNLEMQAAYERQEGVETARRQKISAILNMADDKAKMAGNNISMSSDTVLNLERDVKINSELNALTTLQNSEQKAQNLLDKRNSLYHNTTLIAFNSKLNTKTTYNQLGNNMLNSTANALNSIK